MAATPSTSAAEILRRYLRADSPRRERSAAFGMACSILISLPMIIFNAEAIGPPRQAALLTLLLSLMIYEGSLIIFLRTGRYSLAIPWISALVECSSLAGVFWIDSVYSGGLDAYAAPYWVVF